MSSEVFKITKQNSFKIPSLVLGILLLAVWVLTATQPRPFVVDKNLTAPPKTLVHFHFGFNEVMADAFWLRAVQDFDYCENQLAQNLCQGQGWLYQILDVTSDLSPKFRMPLAAGSLALSIVISDIEGASKLFNKAVERFPKDWPILYRAAYHALYEEKNNEKAAKLLIRAGQNGAPPWTFSLAAKLYTEAGQRELAEKILQDGEGLPEEIRERIRQKLQLKQ